MEGSSETVRVLHVDDEPEFGELAATFLPRVDERIEVVTETSASEAFDRFLAGGFDCIVSDYKMPEMDGLAFLTAVRSEDPHFPFVLFTGHGSEEIAGEAISAGVTDYVQKSGGPSQYTVLANRINNAVTQHRAVRRAEVSHRAMETAREGISLVEPDGTFSYVNPAFAALFSYDRDELVGRHWTVIYPEEEARRLANDILPAVPETGYWSGETVRSTKGGERLVTDHRLANTDEGVIVCTARDVTGERAAPEERHDGLALLVDAMDDRAFYTLDHEGYVTRWNEGAKRFGGYDVEEILGEHLSRFFPETDRRSGLPDRLIETAKADGSVDHEGWWVRKDGDRFRADVTIAASYDDAGTLRGFGTVLREADERSVSH